MSDLSLLGTNVDWYAEAVKQYRRAKALEARLDTLVKKMQDICDGNYPSARKNEKCKHGQYGYDHCDECITDAITAALHATQLTKTAETVSRNTANSNEYEQAFEEPWWGETAIYKPTTSLVLIAHLLMAFSGAIVGVIVGIGIGWAIWGA